MGESTHPTPPPSSPQCDPPSPPITPTALGPSVRIPLELPQPLLRPRTRAGGDRARILGDAGLNVPKATTGQGQVGGRGGQAGGT